MLPAFTEITEITAVLFELKLLEQTPPAAPEDRLVIVMVVDPLLFNVPVAKEPEPAVATVIETVSPVPVLAPVRL